MLNRFRTKPVVQPSALVEAESIYFQCPSCGASFKVSSEFSERIYCGPCVRVLTTESALQRTTPEVVSGTAGGRITPQIPSAGCLPVTQEEK